MKLGSTQRLVLDNVAARLAPYAGHKSHAEYVRRMDVARDLSRRGLLDSLPFGHPENTGPASMYRLTAAGASARSGCSEVAMPGKRTPAQIKRDIAVVLAENPIHPRDAESPELWSDVVLEAQVARYLRRWPGRHNSVRLFGAMMAELVERRRAGGAVGSDGEIESGLRVELGPG